MSSATAQPNRDNMSAHRGAVRLLVALLACGVLSVTCTSQTCTATDSAGGSCRAIAQAGDNRLSPDNAVVLFVDHQSGLYQLVHDYDVVTFRNNVLALVATAKLFNLPTVLTTSFDKGPNGPLMPEIREAFPDAPLIARPGQINAWDNDDFVKAVKATGRKKLIIAGIVTDVCIVFPTLSALAEGFEVYVVVDASGTFSTSVRDAALARVRDAGAITINWFALACELQRDWRNDAEGLANLLGQYLPEYGNLIQSYTAQSPNSKS